MLSWPRRLVADVRISDLFAVPQHLDMGVVYHDYPDQIFEALAK